MMIKKQVWATATLNPSKILLDVKNPRIEVAPNASQAKLREKLIESEDVLDLARGIEKNDGLFYGERIVTVIEDGNQVVLEGNRRVAACQMLLSPALVPSSYRTRFPKASSALKTKLRKMLADVAPSRMLAEPILTKRHTEQNAKPWTPVAKMRRAARLIDEGMDFDQAAAVLGSTPASVKKLLRPYRLLKYAINLGGWTKAELSLLQDEKLVVTPYTRLFTLKPTKKILQISFDDDQNIQSTLPTKVFKEQMAKIARDFLLPDPENTGKAKINTRTDPEAYFADFVASPAGGSRAPNPVGATSAKKPATTTRPQVPKASVFFENLECHVQDDNLIKIKNEIKLVSYEKMTISATLLTRALFESALVYKVRKQGLWTDLMTQVKAGQDPGLALLIRYCAARKNNVFSEMRICDVLGSTQTMAAKDYLDSVAHMKYREADATSLLSAANNLRRIIQHILEGK